MNEPSTQVGSDLAWSQADDDTEEFAHHRATISVVLVVLLGVLVAVATWFASTLYGGTQPEAAGPQQVTALPSVESPPMDFDLPTQLSGLPNAAVQDTDSRYFAILRTKNVTLTSGDTVGALKTARQICAYRAQGVSVPVLESSVQQMNSALAYEGAVAIVTTAIDTYCP